MLGRKDSEAAKLDPISALERSNDLAENYAYNFLDVALVKVRMSAGDTLHEFGPNH
ncbi:hypothetical protein ACVWYQ_003131 [Bradyrhizobium sp. USDA 3397]